jgi:hypothetical protein
VVLHAIQSGAGNLNKPRHPLQIHRRVSATEVALEVLPNYAAKLK